MTKNISLACRGGGVKSASSAGVIKALEELGYKISRISGTSIGSVVAGLYATGFSAEEILNHLMEYVGIYCEASRALGGTGNFKIMETSINEKIGWKTFSECKIPLSICASNGNFLFRKAVVFSADTFPTLTIGKACRASSSFPFLYQKFHLEYGGETYNLLDGGLTFNPIVEKSENEISILSTFYKRHNKKENHLSLYAGAWKQAEAKADLIIKPVVPMGTLGDEKDLEAAFLLGYEETLRNSDQINSLLQD